MNFDIGKTGVKGVLRFELESMLTAFEEAFGDLTDDQASAFPLAGGFNIAWCVMHLIENHNWYMLVVQGGKDLLPADWDHTRWHWKAQMPTPELDYPKVQWMASLAAAIHRDAISRLDTTGEDEFKTLRTPHADETSKASYLRMLSHSNVHIRWIWQIRGALGLTSRAAPGCSPADELEHGEPNKPGGR